jgi:N-acetylglucosamine-6-phosphate deacetylase
VAVPGLVDLQVNGYAGVDLLTEPERAREVADALAEGGVTAWQPTLITSPTEQVLEATRALATAPRSLGTHLEGPFLSPSRPGTHPVEHLREPDLGLLRLLLDAGPVSCVTLAPELPGALAHVDELVERNITVSLGHTDATAVEAERAFARAPAR